MKRSFYRPPYHQEAEWTFTATCKDNTFDSPLREARTLMGIIDCYAVRHGPRTAELRIRSKAGDA
jgi:hypothetical protein